MNPSEADASPQNLSSFRPNTPAASPPDSGFIGSGKDEKKDLLFEFHEDAVADLLADAEVADILTQAGNAIIPSSPKSGRHVNLFRHLSSSEDRFLPINPPTPETPATKSARGVIFTPQKPAFICRSKSESSLAKTVDGPTDHRRGAGWHSSVALAFAPVAPSHANGAFEGAMTRDVGTQTGSASELAGLQLPCGGRPVAIVTPSRDFRLQARARTRQFRLAASANTAMSPEQIEAKGTALRKIADGTFERGNLRNRSIGAIFHTLFDLLW